jgi:type IV secretory pathway VirB2 component (pilin)
MNSFNFQFDIDKTFIWRMVLFLCAISIIMASSDAAFAQAADTNDVVGQTLCRLVKNLAGGTAKGIATIAIFAVGVGLFLGKLNWGIAAATAAGVGIIFAAPKLVAFLSGNPEDANCPTS